MKKKNILKSLIQSKVNSPVLAFIINFLTSRFIQVRINGTLLEHHLVKIKKRSSPKITLFLIEIRGTANDIKNSKKLTWSLHWKYLKDECLKRLIKITFCEEVMTAKEINERNRKRNDKKRETA